MLVWERQGVGRWADMADVMFTPNDIVKPFENEYGEPMIFWQQTARERTGSRGASNPQSGGADRSSELIFPDGEVPWLCYI
ncbi:hypothetical protein GCM10009864_37520 [Streptomyces lunalinharesii]|uniref:Uncharacterized protein n=1 Tax=Streptomyces lunalinharesii TaxID=333384 RepID=A0ABN3S0K8_9ACTN